MDEEPLTSIQEIAEDQERCSLLVNVSFILLEEIYHKSKALNM